MKKSSAINEKLCQGKDVFERMNYLHQASLFISSKNIALASYYGSTLSGCAKKAVLRIDHNLKKTICKGCQSPLIPGKTATVRLMSKKKKMIKTICNTCKTAKKIPTKKNHKLWTDQPQAVLDTFDYTLKIKANSTKKDDNVKNDLKKADDNVKNDLKKADDNVKNDLKKADDTANSVEHKKTDAEI